MKAIYEKNKLIIWIVGGLTLAGFITGMVLGLWDMALALFGFGIGVPVMIQRHSTIEENTDRRIQIVEENTDRRLRDIYNDVERKPNNIPPQTAEERKRALLRDLDNV